MVQPRSVPCRTIGIGCKACGDGDLNIQCGFGNHIKPHHKTKKMEMQTLEYFNGTFTERESKETGQVKKRSKSEELDKFEFKTQQTPYIKHHKIAVHSVATQVKHVRFVSLKQCVVRCL